MNNYLQRRNNTVPSIFDAFEDFFRPVFASENDYLKSNVRETDAEYQIDVAVPGFKKEQIKISLENGYLSSRRSVPQGNTNTVHIASNGSGCDCQHNDNGS